MIHAFMTHGGVIHGGVIHAFMTHGGMIHAFVGRGLSRLAGRFAAVVWVVPVSTVGGFIHGFLLGGFLSLFRLFVPGMLVMMQMIFAHCLSPCGLSIARAARVSSPGPGGRRLPC
jgi:hypothetical protein